MRNDTGACRCQLPEWLVQPANEARFHLVKKIEQQTRSLIVCENDVYPTSFFLLAGISNCYAGMDLGRATS